jgi:O-antigen/teichoic acid export membrane protein
MIKPRLLLQTAKSKTMLSLLDQVVVRGTRFATTVMIGRFGSDAELGLYSLAFSIVVLVLSFQESLISVPYTVFVKRLDSEQQQREYSGSTLAQALGMNLLSAVLLLISCAVLIGLDMAPGFPSILLILAVLLPFILLREYARRFAFAHLDINAVLAIDIGISVLQLAGLTLLIWSDAMSAANAYWITGAASIIGVGVWLMFSRDAFTWNRLRIKEDMVINWKFGKWVAAASVVSVVHMYLPHWMLAAVYDERATGIFSAYMTVFVLANPFILGMCNVLSPKAAHCFAEGGCEAVSKQIWQFTGFMSTLLLVFAILASILGGRFIELVFGGYPAEDSSIAVLAFGTIGLGVSYTVSSGLRAIDRPQANLWAGLLGLLVTAIVSAVLIRAHDIFGTTIGLVAGFYSMALYRIVAFQIFVRRSISVESQFTNTTVMQ